MRNILLITVLAMFIAAPAFADTSADATATNVQSQGSVGSQQVTTQATAQQGQQQGQTSISGGGSVVGSGNARVGFNNSFNGAAPIRYLPVPAAVPMPEAGQIFARPDYADKGPSFISVRQLVGILNMIEPDQEIVGAKDIEVITQKIGKKRATLSSTKRVTFSLNNGEKLNGGFQPLGVISVRTKKAGTANSAALAAKIAEVARKVGATKVVFLSEGSSKMLKASGWSIGFSYVAASVGSDPSDAGQVGAGGTGFSSAKAQYLDLIYLTAALGN